MTVKSGEEEKKSKVKITSTQVALEIFLWSQQHNNYTANHNNDYL